MSDPGGNSSCMEDTGVDATSSPELTKRRKTPISAMSPSRGAQNGNLYDQKTPRSARKQVAVAAVSNDEGELFKSYFAPKRTVLCEHSLNNCEDILCEKCNAGSLIRTRRDSITWDISSAVDRLNYRMELLCRDWPSTRVYRWECDGVRRLWRKFLFETAKESDDTLRHVSRILESHSLPHKEMKTDFDPELQLFALRVEVLPKGPKQLTRDDIEVARRIDLHVSRHRLVAPATLHKVGISPPGSPSPSLLAPLASSSPLGCSSGGSSADRSGHRGVRGMDRSATHTSSLQDRSSPKDRNVLSRGGELGQSLEFRQRSGGAASAVGATAALDPDFGDGEEAQHAGVADMERGAGDSGGAQQRVARAKARLLMQKQMQASYDEDSEQEDGAAGACGVARAHSHCSSDQSEEGHGGDLGSLSRPRVRMCCSRPQPLPRRRRSRRFSDCSELSNTSVGSGGSFRVISNRRSRRSWDVARRSEIPGMGAVAKQPKRRSVDGALAYLHSPASGARWAAESTNGSGEVREVDTDSWEDDEDDSGWCGEAEAALQEETGVASPPYPSSCSASVSSQNRRSSLDRKAARGVKEGAEDGEMGQQEVADNWARVGQLTDGGVEEQGEAIDSFSEREICEIYGRQNALEGDLDEEAEEEHLKQHCEEHSNRVPDRCGWLLKRTRARGPMAALKPHGVWQRRWFEMKGNRLFYYLDQQDVSPVGMIVLDDVEVLVRVKPAVQSFTPFNTRHNPPSASSTAARPSVSTAPGAGLSAPPCDAAVTEAITCVAPTDPSSTGTAISRPAESCASSGVVTVTGSSASGLSSSPVMSEQDDSPLRPTACGPAALSSAGAADSTASLPAAASASSFAATRPESRSPLKRLGAGLRLRRKDPEQEKQWPQDAATSGGGVSVEALSASSGSRRWGPMAAAPPRLRLARAGSEDSIRSRRSVDSDGSTDTRRRNTGFRLIPRKSVKRRSNSDVAAPVRPFSDSISRSVCASEPPKERTRSRSSRDEVNGGGLGRWGKSARRQLSFPSLGLTPKTGRRLSKKGRQQQNQLTSTEVTEGSNVEEGGSEAQSGDMSYLTAESGGENGCAGGGGAGVTTALVFTMDLVACGPLLHPPARVGAETGGAALLSPITVTSPSAAAGNPWSAALSPLSSTSPARQTASASAPSSASGGILGRVRTTPTSRRKKEIRSGLTVVKFRRIGNGGAGGELRRMRSSSGGKGASVPAKGSDIDCLPGGEAAMAAAAGTAAGLAAQAAGAAVTAGIAASQADAVEQRHNYELRLVEACGGVGGEADAWVSALRRAGTMSRGASCSQGRSSMATRDQELRSLARFDKVVEGGSDGTAGKQNSDPLLWSLLPSCRDSIKAQANAARDGAALFKLFQTFSSTLSSIPLPRARLVRASQTLKDVIREKVAFNGQVYHGRENASALVHALDGAAEQWAHDDEHKRTVVMNILAASSRTVSGGDTYFVIDSLFGCPGSIIITPSGSEADPITVALGPDGGCEVRCANGFHLHQVKDIERNISEPFFFISAVHVHQFHFPTGAEHRFLSIKGDNPGKKRA